MKVPHVQIEILVPVQAQNLFRLASGTRLLLGFLVAGPASPGSLPPHSAYASDASAAR